MYNNLVTELRAYIDAIEATTEKERVIKYLKDLTRIARIHQRLLEKGT